MAGDYSRFGFDPQKHYCQVLQQQGRLVTDRDANEQGSISERRLRAQAVDIMGRCVVPSETPDGFRIRISGSGDAKSLTIGPGRIYADGLLAESLGVEPFALDLSLHRDDGNPLGVLAEPIGEEPTPYFEQPYWPQPAALPEDDTLALVYLKVWHREVTSLVDVSLLEPALGGVDTTTRKQTVWQVGLLEVADDVVCSTPSSEIELWQRLIEPSAARLTTRTVEQEPADNTCLIPQTSGYTGAENQLYRVEIHEGGSFEAATFKWSRDNASIAARIENIDGRDVRVDRIGRDSVLSFQVNGWIEITDDVHEFGDGDGPIPGFMVQVIGIEGNVITLADDLPADFFADGLLHNPRVIKWDSENAIQVSAAESGILLEAGIEIEFAADPSEGEFHTGDYWMIAARTVTGDIDRLDQAPPQGPYYHYCRLALVEWPADGNELPREDDCRIIWPSFDGETCGCSVCVTSETHNNGTLTIQQAISQITALGGRVCLESGEYELGEEPVRIQDRNSIRLTGQGIGTTLNFTGTGPAIAVEGSTDIVLEGFSVLVPGLPRSNDSDPENLGGGPGLLIRNSLRVTVERCAVNQVQTESLFATGIVLADVVIESVIRENVFFTTSGILAAVVTEGNDAVSYLLSADLDISGNLFLTQEQGIGLDRQSLFLAGRTLIQGNTFMECAQGAISSTGLIFGSQLDIRNNRIMARGPGVVVGTDNTRICDNDISSLPGDGSTNAIVVTAGIDDTGIDGLYITGNRLVGLSLSAIVLGHVIHTAMIKQNLIALTEQGGIFMTSEATATALEIEDNQFVGIAQSFNDNTSHVAAVQIVNTNDLRIANNTFNGVAREAIQPPSRAAIEVVGCMKALIIGNDIVGVGPVSASGVTAAIHIQPPFSNIVIQNNIVRRNDSEEGRVEFGDWSALRIVEPSTGGVDVSLTDFDAVSPTDGSVSPDRTFSNARALRMVTRVTVEGRSAMIFNDFSIRDAEPVSNSRVTINGNQFIARGGRLPALEIDSGDACILSGNQITGRPITLGEEIVHIEAPHVVAMSNIIQGPADSPSLQITDSDAFTVVGNITAGQILVNNEPIEATDGTGLNAVIPTS